MLQLKTL